MHWSGSTKSFYSTLGVPNTGTGDHPPQYMTSQYDQQGGKQNDY